MTERNNNQIADDVKNLVIARLDVFPSSRMISIGSKGEFTKDDLIEHVKDGDAIGNTIVAMELEYFQALKDGSLLKQISALP